MVRTRARVSRLVVPVVAGRRVMGLAEIITLFIALAFLRFLFAGHVLIPHLVVLLTIHRILLGRGEFVGFHSL